MVERERERERSGCCCCKGFFEGFDERNKKR
jgi:hypothetical protein